MRSFLRLALVFILLTGGAIAQPAADPDKLLEWHKAMIKVPLPKKERCFKVRYPHTRWVEEECVTPQNQHYRTGPLMWTVGYAFVGKTRNYSAKVTSGRISTSIGVFDRVSVTTESGNPESTDYSLQLNSQLFRTPACAGAEVPEECRGWQQFVYAPKRAGFLQYWLINYRKCCPDGWAPVKPAHCTRTSESRVPAPSEPISNLIQVSIGGTAFRGEEVLTVRTGEYLRAREYESILGLAADWRGAEFGVFGDGNGHIAQFNAGAALTVRTIVFNGTTDAPVCCGGGLTGEANSLELVGCCPYGGPAPAIVVRMSNEPGAIPSEKIRPCEEFKAPPPRAGTCNP